MEKNACRSFASSSPEHEVHEVNKKVTDFSFLLFLTVIINITPQKFSVKISFSQPRVPHPIVFNISRFDGSQVGCVPFILLYCDSLLLYYSLIFPIQYVVLLRTSETIDLIN